jgi:ABC-type transport system involved in multi-copper enzyme maturation permease subunit
MKNIWVIAANTFRETIRDRILYGILGFAVLYILLDLFLAKLSLGDLAMIKSFGLAGIYVFGLIITIFLGASIIYKEIERRTLYFVLSKPVAHRDVVLGKFLGLTGAVALTTALMTIVYLVIVATLGGGFDGLGLLAVCFQFLEVAVFVVILIFISSIAAPLTSTLCAVIVLFFGHLLGAALANARQAGGALYRLLQAFYYLLPNLEKFNLRNLVVHHIGISFTAAVLAVGYAALYIAILLWGAVLILKRREL